MMRKMSLRIKLFIIITLIVLISFSIVSLIVSRKSVEISKEDTFLLADEMAAKYSYEIRSELQAARVSSESLMIVFKTLIERGEANRDTLNAILQNSLKQKEYIISFCVAFEPDKLDGKDAEYAGQYPLYGESGRYAPYWSMQDGKIGVEPLSDFDNDVWYAGARDTGKEYITDPFIYYVQGRPVLMTSLVFPLLIDGEFIGIVSSDMALKSLQEMVSHVNTSGLNEYTEIYSNSGIVVAHPKDQYFNKNVYAASVYNMLLADPARAAEALKAAHSYINAAGQKTENAASDEADNTDAAFVASLAAYVQNSAAKLDLSLLSNAMAKELLKLDAERLRIADQATASIKEGKAFSVTQDGYYTIYMPVHFSEATNPWSVAVNVPISEVLHRAEQIGNQVMLVSAVAIAVVALLLYFATRNLTQPILNLAGYARQVGEGRFHFDMPEPENGDEVGILSSAFKTMTKQINDLVSKLTNYSEELKKKNDYLKELNERLVEARDQAEAANRAKSTFLSNMSHEMRTPLNAIVGMTAIGRKSQDEEKKNYSFGKIGEASTHLLALINNVLDMSKIEANKLELAPHEFSFAKMLESAVALVDVQRREKEQTLNTDVDKNIPDTLIGDSFRLSQVMVNLLSNAIKFTGNKGAVGLKAFVAQRVGSLYTLRVEISDTGIGIRPEQQAKLFRMFEQADNSTSRSFGGTGLGLALSKRIVELMDGEIGVLSEENKGSTFYFTVKLEQGADNGGQKGANSALADASCRDSGTSDEQAADDAASNDFSGKKILLAEDIEINREIVIAMLESTHIAIDCAENGQEAYDLFAANPGAYDAILMDIQMPVLDGVEAAKLIRTIDKQVPIIALTANVLKDDVDKYFEIGITSHIGKPLDYSLTLQMLRKYLYTR